MSPPPRRPDPEPLETNDFLTVAIGMALWAVTGLVLLFWFRGALERHDAEWWLWTCLTGFVMGFYGLWFARHRRRPSRDRGPAAPPPAG